MEKIQVGDYILYKEIYLCKVKSFYDYDVLEVDEFNMYAGFCHMDIFYIRIDNVKKISKLEAKAFVAHKLKKALQFVD